MSLKTLARVIFGVVLTGASYVAASERPNIIFLPTDDQRDSSFGGMGHPWVNTPHVDRLLERSVRFTNMYISKTYEPFHLISRLILKGHK